MSNIFVKIARLGAAVKEFFLTDGGTTVGDVLSQAAEPVEGYEIRVDGSPATPETSLHDGAIITLVPAIRGGTR
ncbi:MAG: MoaD/ThiS family protein [Patescibacteria group bacterium]